MSAPLIPGLLLPPSMLRVRRGRSAGCLRFAPPPTRLVLSTPGPRPFGRPLPHDRSRSALVLSQHLGGLLQRQGCRHIAARYRQGFTALPLDLPAWQARPEHPSGTQRNTHKVELSSGHASRVGSQPLRRGPRKRDPTPPDRRSYIVPLPGVATESPLSTSAQPRCQRAREHSDPRSPRPAPSAPEAPEGIPFTAEQSPARTLGVPPDAPDRRPWTTRCSGPCGVLPLPTERPRVLRLPVPPVPRLQTSRRRPFVGKHAHTPSPRPLLRTDGLPAGSPAQSARECSEPAQPAARPLAPGAPERAPLTGGPAACLDPGVPLKTSPG